MSVIIKGMKMPSSCRGCDFIACGFEIADMYCIRTGEKIIDGQANRCPLVEIPKNHGRLIDGDRLFKTLDETAKEFISDTQGNLHIDYIADEFNDAPTILDAEGE